MSKHQQKERSVLHPLALAVASGLALNVTGVCAQQNNGGESQPKEVITVTAQKRSQSVMEVPLAVDAIGAELLKDTGSVALGDIATYTPGFSFSKNDVVQATATMRGISCSNISTGGDPSVAIFFDDVYLPRAAQSVMFSDLQRIEVLKGPQGTLFGKNAAAGVVSMYPNQPDADKEGFFKVRLGNYQLKRFEGMLNIPLSDELFLRVNGISNQRDSYIDNQFAQYDGDELGNRDQQAARIALKWQASDATDLQLSYDWDNLDQGYAAQVGVSEFAFNQDPGSRKMASDVQDGHEARDMTAITLKLNHEFSDAWSAKLVSSYRQWEVSGRDDTDGTADNTRYVDTVNIEDSDIFYNELQLNYQNDKVNFVAGMTYSEESVYQRTTINLNADTVTRLITEGLNDTLIGTLQSFDYPPEMIAALGLPVDHIWQPNDWATVLSVLSTADPGVAELLTALGSSAFAPELPAIISATGDVTYDALANGLGESALLGPGFAGQLWGENIDNTGEFKSYGLYSDLDYQLTEQWGIAVGLRYSIDKKQFSWQISENTVGGVSLPTMINNLFPLIEDLNADKEWKKLTGRVLTHYALDDDQLLYLSYSTGYKAGGFDSLDPTTAAAPFDPEDITNLELGYKADLVDALRVQLSVYDMSIDGRQLSVNSQLEGSTGLVPIIINGEQDILGAELLLDWQASDSMKFSFITEYRDMDSTWEPFYNYLGELQTDSNSATSATTYTITADWLPDFRVLDGDIKVHVDYFFEENTAKDNVDLLPVAYSINGFFDDTKRLNSRISWTSNTGEWEVAVWGNNLLDNTSYYNLGGFAAEILGTPTLRVSDPRTFGIDLQYRY